MEKRAAIDRYRELFFGVNGIIQEWNPYDLCRSGEIGDEFSDEVAAVLYLLRNAESESDAIDAVHRVFSRSFFTHDFSR